MSSTNRLTRGGGKHDYFVTPIPVVEKFLRAWAKDNTLLATETLVILDPCAGGQQRVDSSGEIPMSYPLAISNVASEVFPHHAAVGHMVTMDIRGDSLARFKGDYLTTDLRCKFGEDFAPDIIITNPPFNIALPIIKKALEDVRNGGWVVMLLRLNFFGSQNRFDFWQTLMPERVYVHSKRINFTPGQVNPKNGKLMTGDSIEYAHMVWRRGHYPASAQLRVI